MHKMQSSIILNCAPAPTPPLAGAIELASFFYAALLGNPGQVHRPKISSREPAMRAHGLDPKASLGPLKSKTEPSLGERLALGAWEVARKVDEKLGRALRAQFVNAAHPLCQIEHNSSVAELREAVEAMGLVLTSSVLPELIQAMDLREGASLLEVSALAQREQEVQLHDCLFCVDKTLPRSQFHHLLAVIENVADSSGRALHFITNDPGLSQGACMGDAVAGSCGKVGFDACHPEAIYDMLLNQTVKEGEAGATARGIAVFIGNASDIKAVEGSYSETMSNRSSTLVSIRSWGTQDPACLPAAPAQALARKSSDPNVATAVVLALGIPALTLTAGLGAWHLWGKLRQTQQAQTAADTATEVHFST